jgi:hypothetical protein
MKNMLSIMKRNFSPQVATCDAHGHPVVIEINSSLDHNCEISPTKLARKNQKKSFPLIIFIGDSIRVIHLLPRTRRNNPKGDSTIKTGVR